MKWQSMEKELSGPQHMYLLCQIRSPWLLWVQLWEPSEPATALHTWIILILCPLGIILDLNLPFQGDNLTSKFQTERLRQSFRPMFLSWQHLPPHPKFAFIELQLDISETGSSGWTDSVFYHCVYCKELIYMEMKTFSYYLLLILALPSEMIYLLSLFFVGTTSLVSKTSLNMILPIVRPK